MNALRAHISGFLFKHKQAQVVVINVATLTSLGVRMAPWGLPLLVGGKKMQNKSVYICVINFPF